MIIITHNEKMSVVIKDYFTSISEKITEIYKIAEKARRQGLDPVLTVEIPIAKDIADRVEGLIGPPGVGERIRFLEMKGYSREKVAFKIAEEISKGKLVDGEKEKLAEQAIRTALAIITESITAAPLEGIAKVKIRKNFDNSQYLAVYYAGPIRSAGGTAAGMSVLIADYVRRTMDLDRYMPTDREIERYIEEINLYNRIMNLQLPTTKEELRFAAENLTVEITGEPTNPEEVSGNRDLKRVETNRIRGGACLVFNDGLVGRAKKIHKRVLKHKLRGWGWLKELIKIHETVAIQDISESDKIEPEKNKSYVKPDTGYIQDVIAGRPVFAHPSVKGGFRLRYGRSRATGLAGLGIHPALMGLTYDFLACGTHIRTERPGKGSIVMPVDSIHPPIVRLKNGDVIKVDSYEQACKIRDNLDSILFVGDMLFGVGEYNQNNYDLVPSGYCEEWWVQELEERVFDLSDELKQSLFDRLGNKLNKFITKPFDIFPDGKESIVLARILDIPIHPKYTYHWNDISINELIKLRDYFNNHYSENAIKTHSFPYSKDIKDILEKLYVPHTIRKNSIELNEHFDSLTVSMAIANKNDIKVENYNSTLELVNNLSKIIIRDKCPVYTGARMGRPEKAKARRMRPPVHLLFPIEGSGGRLRDLNQSSKKDNVKLELFQTKCPKCGKKIHSCFCPECQIQTKELYFCKWCKIEVSGKVCPNCNRKSVQYLKTNFPMKTEIEKARKKIGGLLPNKIKAVKKLMNEKKIPELIEKGILRAKYNVYVYRDGTARFDATDAALTHFKPEEIDVSVHQLKQLGYFVDINGKPLLKENQMLELKPQDIIINSNGGIYLKKVANYIDDLLESIYGLPRFYNAETVNDLIGHIVIGLAPHTSAGIAGRLIGFTKAKVIFAHPYWHAAKRRNCLSGEEKIKIWDTEKKQLFNKPLGDIVNAILKKGANAKIVDAYGTLEIENIHSHWRTISIDPETHEVIFQPIKSWIKGKSTDWITILTKTGEKIKMTPSHNMLVWDQSINELVKRKAWELKKHDKIPIMSNIGASNIKIPSKTNIQTNAKCILKSFYCGKRKINVLDGSSFIPEKKGSIILDEVVKIDFVEDFADSYCLEVHTIKKMSLYHNFSLAAALTMNCDGDEDSIILALDAFLNFSKSFLPSIRGGMMDAPLVLVSTLNPYEVDDESHNVDTSFSYPLSFYNASLRRESPKNVLPLIDIVSNRLNTESAYEGFGYSHETSMLFQGPSSTDYKKLNTMHEKVEVQLKIAKKIDSVNPDDVASRVIVNHFIPDLIGNLKRYAGQKIRCTNCNTTYRRIPLSGICHTCKSDKLNLTVYEKSVTKYLSMVDDIAEQYNLSEYLLNRISLIKHNLSMLFGKSSLDPNNDEIDIPDSQVNLGDFFVSSKK